jgi:ABC-2 type transport system ATP-binding protein
MDQPAAAEIVNLHKTFKTGLGKPVVHAVRGIDMSIRQGEVYGLIGPNGSGKSTLMKALLGLVRPTEGSCAIFGKSSLSPDSKEEVGFLPENPYFYKFLTGAETVSFYGKLCGLSGKSLKENCWTWWGWPTRRTGGWAVIPRECSSASAWRRPWFSPPACWCWTNRPPA